MYHDSAPAKVQDLCNEIVHCLAQSLTDVLSAPAAKACKVSTDGQTICRIHHRRDKLAIGLRCDPDRLAEITELSNALGLGYTTRTSFDNNWGARWPISFLITAQSEITRFRDVVCASFAWLNGNQWEPVVRLAANELDPAATSTWPEGTRRQTLVNGYERSPEARLACLAHYGTSCSVCGFNFEARYGDIGRGFIHVHHLVPIASIGKAYLVDPISDLRPVCPNCHEMLHRHEPPYSIDELKRLIR